MPPIHDMLPAHTHTQSLGASPQQLGLRERSCGNEAGKIKQGRGGPCDFFAFLPDPERSWLEGVCFVASRK